MLFLFYFIKFFSRINICVMNFRALTQLDCNMLYNWYNMPHVKKWFPNDAVNIDQYIKRHKDKLEAFDEWNYIAEYNSIPFGYICLYDASIDSDNIGFIEPVGTYGMELFIGNPDFIGKGFGQKMLLSFIEMIIKQNKNINRIILDPNPDNIVAYNLYLKLGFTPFREFYNPNYGKLVIMALDI